MYRLPCFTQALAALRCSGPVQKVVGGLSPLRVSDTAKARRPQRLCILLRFLRRNLWLEKIAIFKKCCFCSSPIFESSPQKFYQMIKTIFDTVTREEIIARIDAITPQATSQWGTMNLYQMLTHCARWEEMILRKKMYKRSFIGRFIGRSVLKSILKADLPLRRSMPTIPELVVVETTGSVPAAKAKWISLLSEYSQYSDLKYLHPFFGKMTNEEIGLLVYKHADHHLRQFSC